MTKKHHLWKTIADLEKRAKGLRKEYGAMITRERELQDVARAAKKTILMESKMLSNVEWEATTNASGGITLTGHIEQKDPIREIISRDGFAGGSMSLRDGIELSVDDNTAWLQIRDPKRIADFIRYENLKVVTTTADKNIQDLRAQADALEEMRRVIQSRKK